MSKMSSVKPSKACMSQAPDACEVCECDPCECEMPAESRSPSRIGSKSKDDMLNVMEQEFNLVEFIKAKEYFSTPSSKTGIAVYDHLAEVLRKIYDERPFDPVDYLEEISYGIKRIKFRLELDIGQTPVTISPKIVSEAETLLSTWQKKAFWYANPSEDQEEEGDEDTEKDSTEEFPNLMKVAYYLQEINAGLPQEEMYHISLALRQHTITHPVTRARFWGKVFCSQKNYYVIEAELTNPNDEDLWIPNPEKEPTALALEENALALGISDVIDASKTMQKASGAVTDPETLSQYAKSSGMPTDPNTAIVSKTTDEEEFIGEGERFPEDPEAAKELEKWEQYKNELMTGFPTFTPGTVAEIPPEEPGSGLNRRVFYVCNDLNEPWKLLPNTTPKEINGTRKSRWILTGNLDAKIKTFPEFIGYEGNYLRALLARITAATLVSPKGYYRLRKPAENDDEEEEDEDIEEEEEGEDAEDKPITDLVYPARRFRPASISDLLNPSLEFWVHHASSILRQGRADWWNQKKAKQMNDEEEEFEGEDEDEPEDDPQRETGPKLFTPLAEDKILDETQPWSVRASSTVFTEFQIASVHSNLWPGASAYCTLKGKVNNIYFGDGNKFQGQTSAPDPPTKAPEEYKEGPEMIEVRDPTVDEEQEWISKFKVEVPEEEAEEEEEEMEEETENEQEEEEEQV